VNAAGAVAIPPAVVTATLCAPADPAGVTAVIDVSLTTTTLVAAFAPIFTTVAPVKFVPVMVIAVPPANTPEFGFTNVMVGNGVTYVNAFGLLALPPSVVTATICGPTAPSGVTALMEVALTTVKLVTPTDPIVTMVAPVKFVPVMVINVPPRVEPELGLTLEIVGAGAMYVNAPPAVNVPPTVVSDTDLTPAVPAGVTAVTWVASTTTTLVAATAPTFTLLAPVKFVPVMVNKVPPLVGPASGLTEVMVGAGVP